MKSRAPTAPSLNEAELRFIERIGLYFETQGAPRIGGRILGLLVLEDEPLTLEQVAERLHVARASVSTNMRQLIAAGICEHVGVPGERRHYYRYADDAWSKHLELMLRGLGTLETIFSQAMPNLGPRRAHARDRMRLTCAYLAFSQKEIAATLQRWRKQTSRASKPSKRKT